MNDIQLYVTVPSDENAAHTARTLLDRAMTRWCWGADGSRADALLLISELVGNAVEHGGGGPRIPIQLTRSGRRLRISVTDASPTHPSVGTDSGYGLRMVQAIASQWASTPHPYGGKTVWCELTEAPRPRSVVPSHAIAA
jgi:anti-sigma regulatory factor (Ser/Thr protein kinase)